MQKSKTKIKYANRRFSLDWIVVALLLLLGSVGVRIAGDSNAWNSLIANNEFAISVGKVDPKKGRVRYHRLGTSVWLDISEAQKVSEGDRVSTSANSEALIHLYDVGQIKLLQNSLVDIHIQSIKAAQNEGWLGLLSSYNSNITRTNGIIEIKKGTLDLSMANNGQQVVVIAGGKRLLLSGNSSDDSVRILVDPDHPNSMITVIPQGQSSIKMKTPDSKSASQLQSGKEWVLVKDGGKTRLLPQPMRDPKLFVSEQPKETQPIVPQITAPLHGARFISKTKEREEIALRWKPLPPGMVPEIELRRFDDPEFRTAPITTQRGGTVTLPDGNYTWKVRSVDSKGNVSEWSPAYNFSVQENVKGNIPVALLESIKQEKQEHEIEVRKQREVERQKVEEDLKRQAQQRELARLHELAKVRELKKEAELARIREETSLRKMIQKQYAHVVDAARVRIEELGLLEKKIKTLPITTVDSDIDEGRGSEGIPPDDEDPSGNVKRSIARATTRISENTKDLNHLRVRLKWKPVSGVGVYRVKIYHGKSELKNIQSTDSHYDMTMSTVENQEKYTYEVKATLPKGRVITSDLTPIEIEVAAPTPVEPGQEANTSRKEPIHFTWAKTLLTDHYEFELASDIDFHSIVYRSSPEENVILVLLTDPGTYYWRVRGSAVKFKSRWSTTQKFYVR